MMRSLPAANLCKQFPVKCNVRPNIHLVNRRLIMTRGLTASKLLFMILVFCFALRLYGAENAWGLKSEIAYGDRTVLMGVAATPHGGVKAIDMHAGKVGWIEPWTSADDSLTWNAHVERTGDYEVSSILESSGDR